MTISTYYRFFIPLMFPEYDRVLYLDCDLIVDYDISELMEIDFEGKLVMASRDCYVVRILKEGADFFPISYATEVLKMSDPYAYFNAGVMVYNLKEFRKKKLETACFEVLKEIGQPYFQDQDVLNAVVSRNGGVKWISEKYNLNASRYRVSSYFYPRLFAHLLNYFLGRRCWAEFYVYHYVGKDKPWATFYKDSVFFYAYLQHDFTPKPFQDLISKENKGRIPLYKRFFTLLMIKMKIKTR